MDKIKVLQFPIANMLGGKTQYVMQNWKHIDRTRFQFDFMTVSKSLDFADELLSQGCKIHYISCRAEEDEKRFAEDVKKALLTGYDAIHLHTGFWQSFTAEEIAMRMGIKSVILHSHNTGIGIADDSSRENATKWHERQKKKFSCDMATHFLACSTAAADWLYGPQIPREKITILKNAVDVDRYSFNPEVRNEYRRKLGLEDKFVIGHVGRFEYQKNHEFLIDVFEKISKKISNAELILIGTGSEYDKIVEKVTSLGLSSRVRFLGKRDDVANLFQAMDIFVLPSFFEGLAIVLVEAQTSGLKSLTSHAAFPEFSIPENTISLALDIDIWQTKILDIAHNGYKRKSKKNEVIAAGFSIQEQVRVLEEIYEFGEYRCEQ